MCCCGKPTVNGDPGYSWDGKSFSVRNPWFPELQEGDELIKDLPGRCGGVDSHCHDLRLVKRHSQLYLLVHNGGGDTRIKLRAYGGAVCVETMAENDCYWVLLMLFHVQSDGARFAREAEAHKWQKAAADGRLKTRKQRGQNSVKVWIDQPALV